MPDKVKHFVQLFCEPNTQINVVTYMSFKEIEAELDDSNFSNNINLLGIDQEENRVTVVMKRSHVKGYLYGILPNQRIVTPVQINSGMIQ